MDWQDACLLPESPHFFKANSRGSKASSNWPVKISGLEIGCLEGLTEVAIQATPCLTVWAFASDGSSKAWQLSRNEVPSAPHHQVLSRDGSMSVFQAHDDSQPEIDYAPEGRNVDSDGTEFVA